MIRLLRHILTIKTGLTAKLIVKLLLHFPANKYFKLYRRIQIKKQYIYVTG